MRLLKKPLGVTLYSYYKLVHLEQVGESGLEFLPYCRKHSKSFAYLNRYSLVFKRNLVDTVGYFLLLTLVLEKLASENLYDFSGGGT